jgi:AcrR family transcriptional regulator
MAQTRRELVLRAVRQVVAEGGVASANVRDIAQRAGYTAGALYAYFPGKQALFEAVLADSLARAQAAAQSAKVARGAPEGAFAARAQAWFAYFLAHPAEAHLLLHVLTIDGRGPGRLGEGLAAALLASLAPVTEALQALGCSAALLQRETMALLSMAVGVLLIHDPSKLSGTNALAVEALAAYIESVHLRVAAVPAQAVASESSAQVDLFG